MGGFKKIVVCSDFSENADKAFDVAAAMAEGGGQLTVLHVVPAAFDYERMARGLGSAAPLGSAALDDEAIRQRLLERYGSRTAVPCEAAVVRGNEAHEIVKFAEENGADVIVMGARGIGFIAGLLGGGSVVDKVVKSATMPVIVVPH